jgi:hypothetical protein
MNQNTTLFGFPIVFAEFMPPQVAPIECEIIDLLAERLDFALTFRDLPRGGYTAQWDGATGKWNILRNRIYTGVSFYEETAAKKWLDVVNAAEENAEND